MKIKYLLLIVLFCTLDFFLFLYFQKSILTFKSMFWISHFILTFFFIYLNSKISKDKQFDIFILIFPIIGYLFVFINQFLFFKKYFENEVEINEDMKKYILTEEKEIIVNQSIDLNLIGAYDILAVGTPSEKKKFLINFETLDLTFKVQVLKKALWDSDIEVIHYAATEINKIDENFQKLIKDKILEKNFDSLCDIYFDYCNSGLLLGEILDFYQNKFIELIGKKKILNKKDKYKLLVLYKNMKKYKECDEIIEKIGKDKDYNIETLNFIKKYYYDLNNHKMLKEVEKWQKSV